MKPFEDWKPLVFRTAMVLLYLVVLGILLSPYSLYLLKGLFTHSLSSNEVFLYDHDWIQQGIPYYREFFRCIEEGTLQWSWNEFLGTPFYASKATYVIGDPFAWLTYGLYKSAFHYLPTALFVITGFKLLVAGIGFALLLEKITSSKAGALLFGAVYMCSGWVSIFMEQVYFLSFYALIPYVLLGVELILKKRWHVLFYPAILITLSTNVYLSWSLCWFLLLYWFVRAGDYGLKGRMLWKETGKVLITFLLAFLSAMIILLPGIMVLLKSPRLSGHLIDYSFWSKDNICAILMNFFIPVIDSEHLLYHDYWYYFYQIGIYCGSFVLLCVPQVFLQKREKSEKIRYGIFLGIPLLMLVTPKAGLLFNLSYSLRYTYYIELALLILGAKSLEQSFHRTGLIVSAIIYLVTASVLVFMTSSHSFSELLQYPEAIMLWIVMALILVYCGLIGYEKKIPYARVTVMIIAILEVSLMSNVTIRTKSKQREPAEYLYQNDALMDVYERIKEYDTGFFRVNLLEGVNAHYSLLPNSSMYYGIPALSGYDSVYCSGLYDFLDWQGLYPSVSWNFRINDARLNRILASEYTIVSPATVPLLPENAQKMDSLSNESFAVYRNPDVSASAFTITALTPKSTMTAMMDDIEGKRNQRLDLLAGSVIVDDALYETWNTMYTDIPSQSFEGSRSGSDISYSVSMKQEAPVFFSIPSDSGWKMKIDGTSAVWYQADGGFIAAIIPQGDHEVSFHYETPGLKAGLILSVIGIALSIIWLTRPVKGEETTLPEAITPR